MVEEWRPIAGRDGYEVSNHGRVRSYRNEQGHPQAEPRIMLMSTLRGGYRRVKFGRGPQVAVHHLVLETFVGPRPAGLVVRHRDGKPGNNRVDNLVWGTPEENYADRHDHGTANDGSRNGRARLTEAQVIEIRASNDSHEVLAERFGVSLSTIKHIHYRRTWRHILEATQC